MKTEGQKRDVQVAGGESEADKDDRCNCEGQIIGSERAERVSSSHVSEASGGWGGVMSLTFRSHDLNSLGLSGKARALPAGSQVE